MRPPGSQPGGFPTHMTYNAPMLASDVLDSVLKTADDALRTLFASGLDPTDKAVRVARYAQRVQDEVEMIAHACGLTDATGFLPRHVTAIERGVGGFRAAQGSD